MASLMGGALSGITSAAADLSITGNNIANSGTTGFKASRVDFGSVFAVAASGQMPDAHGVNVQKVRQEFQQGALTDTESYLDLAIVGSGFFKLRDPSADQGKQDGFTRNGAFHMSPDGYVVNNSDMRLQGTVVGDVGGGAFDIQITDEKLIPSKTSRIEISANLDAGKEMIKLGSDQIAFDPDNSETYHHTSRMEVFDSLGNKQEVNFYMRHIETDPQASNAWEMRSVYSGADDQNVESAPVVIQFGPNGKLVKIDGVAITDAAQKFPASFASEFDVEMPVASAVADGSNGAVVGDAGKITLNLMGMTQFNNAFQITRAEQDGYTSGNLDGVFVDGQGVVNAQYTNGETVEIATIPLYKFRNNTGLLQKGANIWESTALSGDAIVGTPAGEGFGSIASKSLEASSVDLTAELVHLIQAQRNFQANTRVISAAQKMDQAVLQM